LISKSFLGLVPKIECNSNVFSYGNFDLLNKLNGSAPANVPVTVPPQQPIKSSFTSNSPKPVNSKSNFGIGGLNVNQILIILAVIGIVVAFLLMKK
jgi:hypothetical protein